ncbi:MAG: hypothetical protein R3F10_12395 [Lysobacteraceae bacterium]
MKKLTWLVLPALMLAASQAHADAKSDVIAAYEKAYAKGRYTATMTGESRGKAQRTTVRVQFPGSFHIITDASEIIVLPGGTYMKAGAQWMQVPVDMSKMVENVSMNAYKEGANAVQDVREIGSRNVGGCNATLYAYRVDGKTMGLRNEADVELAVCNSSGLPVQVVSADKKNRSSVDFDFETSFEIKRPM